MKTKEEQLGSSLGAARNKLHKSILFDLAQRLKLDNCFHCGEPITDIDTFSIEHKIPWKDSENPIELYFNLENIAFSHLKCNCAAARKPNKKYENTSDRKQAQWKKYWDKMGKEKQRQRRKTNYEKYKC